MMLHFAEWIFLITPILGSGAVIYIQRLEGQSVDIHCESEQLGSAAMGLNLKHKFPHPERHVACISIDGNTSETPQYLGRVKAHGGPGPGPVHITVSQLRHADTGVYFCEFNHSGVTVLGTTEVFVSVEVTEAHCLCWRYPLLLHIICGAALFFLLTAMGSGLTKFGKRCFCSCCSQQVEAPVYEDMTAIHKRSVSRAPNSHGTQEAGTHPTV
ncbi:uncharacterized protein LOC125718071 isoform X2 [Brienomyrus brachyistius]|uniref:uncharacterized protein LOC125718071 isoform X2 n=1 Tax=Brienomyrus brachyistius TaxID=42636 RepID=UPI0020B1EC30|nr:uncharacterized protein LOC125718071 isoform X2 [Brienomyrus brachyistius]